MKCKEKGQNIPNFNVFQQVKYFLWQWHPRDLFNLEGSHKSMTTLNVFTQLFNANK